MSEPWIARWQEGRIGWHEPDGNSSLRRHWPWRRRRVLVPLCGKSVDMLWLESRDNEVVGAELSEIAVRAFFEENGIDYRIADGGRRFDAADRRITIYCGDYFDLEPAGCNALYDRGALVAVAPALRERYVRHTDSLLADDSRRLLITLEYDRSIAEGPPFSISRDEVLRYWPSLEVVESFDAIDSGPEKFREAGLERMIETVWRTPEPSSDAPATGRAGSG